MIPLGETPAIVEKGGWVYLANAVKGFRALDLDPVEIQMEKALLVMVNTDGVPLREYAIPFTVTLMDSKSACTELKAEFIKDGNTIDTQAITLTTKSLTSNIKLASLGSAFDINGDYQLKISCKDESTKEISAKTYLALGQITIVDPETDKQMKGAITDGVSILKLKLEVVKNFDKFKRPPVLEIVNSDDVKNITATGSLGEGETVLRHVDMDLKAGNGKAQVIYKAPVKFVRFATGKESGDKNSPERFIQIKIDANGEGLPKIILKRPPVNLVHGVWADPSSWDKFAKTLNNKQQFEVFRTNYGDTSADSFESNVGKVNDEIDMKLEKTVEAGFAASKLNYIGHSMGGLLLKDYCVASGNCDNIINKYVSIDSPHNGSELANLIIDVNKSRDESCIEAMYLVNNFKKVWEPDSNRTVVAGGLVDLAIGSEALQKQQGYLPSFPWRAIVGRADDGSWGHSILYRILWFNLKGCCNINPDSSFSTFGGVKPFFIEKNDRIVSFSSQAGTASNIITVDHVDHSTVLEQSETVEAAKQFIEE